MCEGGYESCITHCTFGILRDCYDVLLLLSWFHVMYVNICMDLWIKHVMVNYDIMLYTCSKWINVILIFGYGYGVLLLELHKYCFGFLICWVNIMCDWLVMFLICACGFIWSYGWFWLICFFYHALKPYLAPLVFNNSYFFPFLQHCRFHIFKSF